MLNILHNNPSAYMLFFKRHDPKQYIPRIINPVRGTVYDSLWFGIQSGFHMYIRGYFTGAGPTEQLPKRQRSKL